MAVHMFRVYVDPGPMGGEKLVQTVDDWISKRTKWKDDTVEHGIFPVTDIETGEQTHYQGDVRFEKTEAKDNILQKLTDKLKNKVNWYRVGYHECFHDEDDPAPCTWDASAEFGTVPDNITEFN